MELEQAARLAGAAEGLSGQEHSEAGNGVSRLLIRKPRDDH